MIWVAGRSPTLVSHSLRGVAMNLKATTLTYLAINERIQFFFLRLDLNEVRTSGFTALSRNHLKGCNRLYLQVMLFYYRLIDH